MEVKLKEFKKAIDGFSYLVSVDLKSLKNILDERLIDGIENGMIQKFEYSVEICWKLIKKFLKQKDGIDSNTPKQSVKEFYRAGYIDEDNYLKLIDMIDDRNILSHTYDEEEYRKILNKFSEFAGVFKQVETVITNGLAAKNEQDKVEEEKDAGDSR